MNNKKIKVCYITSAFPSFTCGVGDHIAKIAKELINLDIEVHIITSKQIKIEDYYQKIGIKIYPLVENWNFEGWKQVYQRVREIQPDLVHFEYPTRYPAGRSQILRCLPHTLLFALLSFMKRSMPKRIITIHEYYKIPALAKLKVIFDLWLSHRVILVNRADEHRLNKFTFNKNKIQFMPIGSNTSMQAEDSERSREIRKKYEVSESTNLLCFFGFIDPSRGFEELIESIKDLNQQNLDTKLLVIGGIKDKDYNQFIKKKISEDRLKDKIIWAGFLSNDKLPDYIQACDIAVQPFLAGATSNRSSLIASIILNIPTVTTYIKGITPPEFIDKKNMLLVSPKSSQELSEAIKLLIEDKDIKNNILKGMKKLAQIFNWKESARITKKVYESLL